MDDATFELLKSAHRGLGDVIAGREPIGDDLLAVDVVMTALAQPRPYSKAVQTLLDASRAGDREARAVLKEFGRLAAEEQSTTFFKMLPQRRCGRGWSFL